MPRVTSQNFCGGLSAVESQAALHTAAAPVERKRSGCKCHAVSKEMGMGASSCGRDRHRVARYLGEGLYTW